MPSPDGSHLGPDGWKTPRQPIRSPIRPGGEDWLNGTVGAPWRPSQNFAKPDYDYVRPSSPVDGINFDNKKELNKQLAKLDQDLRNAIAQNDGGQIQRFTQQQQAANDVLKAMKAGYSASEAKDFAAREAEIRAKNNKSNRPNYKPLSAAEEAKRDAEARQQEDMKTRDLQFRLQQEARASEGEPYYNPYPPNNDPYQASRLRAQGLTPDQNQAAINARMRGELAPTKVSKEDDNSFTIQPISNRSKGQTNTGYLAVEPDGTQRWMTQSDWETPQGQKLLKSMGFSSNGGNYSRINELANNALGGKFGEQANAALKQRAAAGDPQAANILENLNLAQNGKPSEYIPAGQPVPGKPGSVADGKGGWSYPNQGNSEIKSSKPSDPSKAAEPPQKRPVSGGNNPAAIQNPNTNRIIPGTDGQKKEPTAEEIAASIDKQNRAREMAAQAAAQREAARKAAENQAARDSAARKMGFPNAAEAEKAGIKIGNPGEKMRAGINSASGGGGGRGRGGGGLTAKERNNLADKRAAEASRREDRGGLSDSAYDQKERDAKWKNTPKLSDPKNKPSVSAEDAWQYKTVPSDGFGGPIPTPDVPLPQIGSSASAGTGGIWRTIDGRKIRIA